jgi:hypothetical protein
MSLPNVQAEFVEALLSKDVATDLVEPSCNLEIYRNNILTNLIEALQNTYPLIQTLLGTDFFNKTAREYIRQYPSRSGNLHDYGEYFSNFLSEYQPVHHLIYLAEVAEFEWACHITYVAGDYPLFDVAVLQQYTEDQYNLLRFVLNPASALRKFHFPILQILDLCLKNPNEIVDLNNEGNNLLIIRKELDIALLPLPKDEFTFLEALQNHYSLIDALEMTQRINPDFNIEEKLPEFIQNKILVDCYLSDEDEPLDFTP